LPSIDTAFSPPSESPPTYQRAEHVGCEARLLVGEERDDERPAAETRRVQRLDRFESAEHAEIAVVAPAGAHRVDVRACHDRRDVLGAASQSEHVADRVDRDLEAELAHPADDEVAARAVLVGEREPAAPAALDRADLGEPIEPPHQAVGVDAQGFRSHPTSSSADFPTICR
jgi:hypothetical protein